MSYSILFPSWLWFIFSVIAEGLFAILSFQEPGHLLWYLIIHFASSFFLFLAIKTDVAQRERDDFFSLLALPCGIFIPYFGIPLIISLYCACYVFLPSGPSAIHDYQDYLCHDTKFPVKIEVTDPLARTLDKLSVEPVVDVLMTDDKELTRACVELLIKIGDRNAVSVIKKLMNEGNIETQILGSWGLEQIETRFLNKRREIRKKLKKAPVKETVLEFVQAQHKFIQSGLLDSTISAVFAQECQTWLDELLFWTPDDSEILALKACTFKLEEKWDESVQLFGKLRSRFQLEGFAYLEYAEALFRKGEINKVVDVIAEFTHRKSNEVFLKNRPFELSLDCLREFWITEIKES